MLIDAEVKADGTLVAQVPHTLWGKKIKIMIQETVPTNSRKKPSQWEEIAPILKEARALDVPRRTMTEILNELHTFRETV